MTSMYRVLDRYSFDTLYFTESHFSLLFFRINMQLWIHNMIEQAILILSLFRYPLIEVMECIDIKYYSIQSKFDT